MCSTGPGEPSVVNSENYREVEVMALGGARAKRSEAQWKEHANFPSDVMEFQVGDLVFVACGELFRGTKWPAVTSKYYGPFVAEGAHHPRYVLQSSSGRRSRSAVHARRLMQYHRHDD